MSRRAKDILFDVVFLVASVVLCVVVYNEFGWQGVAFTVFWLFCMFGSFFARRASRRIVDAHLEEQARQAQDPADPPQSNHQSR